MTSILYSYPKSPNHLITLLLPYLFCCIGDSCLAGKSGNEGQKTFAIIIGSLAGVAILVIFLAFLSKICGRNGKYSITLFLSFFNLFLILLIVLRGENLITMDSAIY